MLGGPVTHDHGGPVRMYVDGQYGYKSTKWLCGIELTADEVPGYWEDRGLRHRRDDPWLTSSGDACPGSARPSGGCTGPSAC